MIEIPIINNLKQKRRKEIAQGQDLLIQEIYRMSSDVVLHGGTAIWRCYKGNRFSWDLDFYFPKKFDNDSFKKNLERIGIEVGKFKISQNSVYATLYYNNRMIKLGGLFKKVSPIVVKQYQLVDGTTISIKTLSEIELLKEKIEAYLNRKKIRDIYDIYYLSGLIKKKKEIRPLLLKLINNYQQPEGEEKLESIIISGVAPSIDDMLNEIKKWAR